MTSFGINNEGQLVFDYYHEDSDQLEDANVYNGQNSTLWVNFREAFADEIKETYQNLRNNGYITYDKLVDQFITNGSDKWSESIYNEDSEFKYISMLKSDNDATNLPQVRGSGEEHFRYFVENRLNYCDSKWYASDYANDYVSLRIYTPTTWSSVEPNASITVTPYSDMYAGVRYKANGTLYQERATHGVPVTFSPQGESFESENNETFNDTETAIYGASQLSSLGDLAPLYCGSVNVASASKLTELKIGDSTTGYSNTNLKELSVGTNKLLKTIDIRNCPNLAISLGLTGCPNIEEIYATGSGITGVELIDGGCLKIAKLPSTIANLTLKNQSYIEELTLEGYGALKTLWIENSPTVDTLDILDKATNVERVRLTNVDWSHPDATILYELIERDLSGIDENGTNTSTMWIDGKCHIETLTGSELGEIKALFPYLTITYDNLTAQLIYMSDDGSVELHRETIFNGGNGTDPVANGTLTTPTKESTAQYNFTYSGWSLTSGGDADANALLKVEADRIVYVAYNKEIRSYTVNFYNDTTLLETDIVEYGSDAVYNGTTPVKDGYTTAEFEFIGWKPEPTNIQGDTNCYAQFYDKREITDDWGAIAQACLDGTATSKYAVGAYKPLHIGAIELPYDFHKGSAVVYNNEIHILGSTDTAYQKAHYKWNGTSWVEVSTLPYEFYNGSTVVYNNELHIFGSTLATNRQKHYKWDGTSWTSVSTLPYTFYSGSVVVYNNEIHILGGYLTPRTVHYKYDGSTWTEVSAIPYDFTNGSAVVYNNEIHIFGSDYRQFNHYKYDGSTWTEASTIHYRFSQGSAIIYNDEIHVLGNNANNYYRTHYKWDGTTLIEVGTLPYDFYRGGAVVYNDKIHILGSESSYCYKNHYIYNDNSWLPNGTTETIPMEVVAHNHDELIDGVNKWDRVSALPYNFYYGSTVMYNNEIHILGGTVGTTLHYKYDGSEWTKVSTLPYAFKQGFAVVYNNEIHIMGSNNSSYYTAHYKYDGTTWTEVSTLPYNFYDGKAVIYNNEIHIMGSSINSYYTAHYKYDGSAWTEVSTLPYNFYDGGAVVFNNEIHIIGSGASGPVRYQHYKYDGSEWTKVSNLPYNFYNGDAIVYNNEIHIFGCLETSYYTAHYKYDGSTWTEVSTLPYGFYYGNGIVYNDEFHILGSGISTYAKNHFKLSTKDWVDDVSLARYDNISVVWKDAIHIFDTTSHKTYDGETVTTLSTLPCNVYAASIVIYNNEIHVLGGQNNNTSHYKYDGTEWASVSTLPYEFYQGSAIVYNNEIHLLGGMGNNDIHYKYDGNSWYEVGALPTTQFRKGGAVVYDDAIHIFMSNIHYKYDGIEWTEVSTLPMYHPIFDRLHAIVYNNEPHIFIKEKHYKWDGAKWSEVAKTSVSFARGSVVVFRGKLHRIGSGVSGYYDIHQVLENPKATLTFLAKNVLKDKVLLAGSNAGGWANTDLRTWCNSTFLSSLPSLLQDSVKTVQKPYDNSEWKIAQSNDKIWVPSIDEVGATSKNAYSAGVVWGQGEAYSVFTDRASRIRTTVDGAESIWILRSRYTPNAYTFCRVQTTGGLLQHNVFTDGYNVPVCFGFCI